MALACLLAIVAILIGCRSTRDYRPLGATTLAQRAEGLLMNAYPDAEIVQFDHGYKGEGTRADDRFPSWARGGFYEHCIGWSDAFRALRTDRTMVAEGTVWGWVLLAEESLIYGSRVLEVSCEDHGTGQTIKLLDAWGPRLVELGVETLVRAAEASITEAFPDAKYAVFAAAQEGEGALAEELHPDWAREAYEKCIYWNDEYTVVSHEMSVVAQGEIWGWILANSAGRTHILEISHRSSETGETVRLIDQWECPEDEE